MRVRLIHGFAGPLNSSWFRLLANLAVGLGSITLPALGLKRLLQQYDIVPFDCFGLVYGTLIVIFAGIGSLGTVEVLRWIWRIQDDSTCICPDELQIGSFCFWSILPRRGTVIGLAVAFGSALVTGIAAFTYSTAGCLRSTVETSWFFCAILPLFCLAAVAVGFIHYSGTRMWVHFFSRRLSSTCFKKLSSFSLVRVEEVPLILFPWCCFARKRSVCK